MISSQSLQPTKHMIDLGIPLILKYPLHVLKEDKINSNRLPPICKHPYHVDALPYPNPVMALKINQKILKWGSTLNL